jgi:hypothetical protein
MNVIANDLETTPSGTRVDREPDSTIRPPTVSPKVPSARGRAGSTGTANNTGDDDDAHANIPCTD